MSFPNVNHRCGEERPASTVDERQHSLNRVVRTRAAHNSNKPEAQPPQNTCGRISNSPWPRS